MKKAVIYCRVSVDPGERKLSKSELKQSISTQKTKGIEYCEKNQYDVIGVYQDSNISGTIMPELRPEFSSLLKDIPKIDIIVVQDASRLSRDDRVAQYIFRLAIDNNVDIQGWKENIDIQSREGVMFFTMMGAINTFQVKKSRDLSVMNRYEKVKSGKFISQPNTYGYRKVGKSAEQRPEEAKIVLRIFNMALSSSASVIATTLNDENLKTRRGSRWQHAGILKILRNRMYIAEIEYPVPAPDHVKVRTPDGKQIRTRRPDTDREFEIYPCPVEPIIEKSLFFAVQKELDSRTFKQSYYGAHLLSNICHCGECVTQGRVKEYNSCSLGTKRGVVTAKCNYVTKKSRTSATGKVHHNDYYSCTYKSYRTSQKHHGWSDTSQKCENVNPYSSILEPAILKVCIPLAFRAAEKHFERLKPLIVNTEYGELMEKLEKVNLEIEKCLQKVKEDIDSGAMYEAIYKKLSDDKRSLESKISKLEYDEPEKITKGFKSIAEQWDSLSMEDKNNALYRICEIYFFRKGVLIKFKEVTEDVGRLPIFLPYDRRKFDTYPRETVKLGMIDQPCYRNFISLPNESQYHELVCEAWKKDSDLRTFCQEKLKLDSTPLGKPEDVYAEFTLMKTGEKLPSTCDIKSEEPPEWWVSSHAMWIQTLAPSIDEQGDYIEEESQKWRN